MLARFIALFSRPQNSSVSEKLEMFLDAVMRWLGLLSHPNWLDLMRLARRLDMMDADSHLIEQVKVENFVDLGSRHSDLVKDSVSSGITDEDDLLPCVQIRNKKHRVMHKYWPWPSRKDLTMQIRDVLFILDRNLYCWLLPVRSSGEKQAAIQRSESHLTT
jgi:hypothetical protein